MRRLLVALVLAASLGIAGCAGSAQEREKVLGLEPLALTVNGQQVLDGRTVMVPAGGANTPLIEGAFAVHGWLVLQDLVQDSAGNLVSTRNHLGHALRVTNGQVIYGAGAPKTVKGDVTLVAHGNDVVVEQP